MIMMAPALVKPNQKAIIPGMEFYITGQQQ